MMQAVTIAAARDPNAAAPDSVLAVLLVVLAASSVLYWVLVRRSTLWRGRLALQEWADAHEFELKLGRAVPAPPAAHVWGRERPAVGRALDSTQAKGASFFDMTLGDGPARRAVHLLVWPVAGNWPLTALRPARAGWGLADVVVPDGVYQVMSTGDRFIVRGADSGAARAMKNSTAPAMLPPDVGLVVVGGVAIFDFSNRPFDAIELTRMVSVATQVASRVKWSG